MGVFLGNLMTLGLMAIFATAQLKAADDALLEFAHSISIEGAAAGPTKPLQRSLPSTTISAPPAQRTDCYVVNNKGERFECTK